jgi:hypothetical protein
MQEVIVTFLLAMFCLAVVIADPFYTPKPKSISRPTQASGGWVKIETNWK